MKISRGLMVAGVAALTLGLSACGESESDRLVSEGHTESYAEGHVDGCRSSSTGVIKRHDKRYGTDEEYKKAWDEAYASCAKSAESEPESAAAPVTAADAAPAATPAATPAADGDAPAKSE
jgi:hypothetical protein